MQSIFCHGLESGPHGRKFQALRSAGIPVESPDFQGMVLAQRVEKLVPILCQSTERVLLIGSSYGGITAVAASMQVAKLGADKGANIGGLLLLAPALERDEPPASDSGELEAVAPTVIIHGRHDEIIPLEVSQRFARRVGAVLIEVEDDHRLAHSSDRIVWETQRFLAKAR